MATRHRVLNTGRLPAPLLARLGAAYGLCTLADEADPQAFLATRGVEFTGLVTSAPVGVDATLIAALPNHEPSLPELARWCDFLVVITAGGAGTRHLIDAEVLDALGPDGLLINVARGSVVDEAALIGALADKRIAGAGLDVYEHEPEVPPALLALDNVVLLPHVASATVQTRQAMADRVFDNLESFFATGQPVSAAPAT